MFSWIFSIGFPSFFPQELDGLQWEIREILLKWMRTGGSPILGNLHVSSNQMRSSVVRKGPLAVYGVMSQLLGGHPPVPSWSSFQTYLTRNSWKGKLLLQLCPSLFSWSSTDGCPNLALFSWWPVKWLMAHRHPYWLVVWSPFFIFP